MHAIALIRYSRPLDEVLAIVEEHRACPGGVQAGGVEALDQS